MKYFSIKKHTIVTLIFVFLFFCCQSQTRTNELGLLGGINLGSFYGTGTNYSFADPYKKNYFGTVAGVQFRYRLNKRYALKTSVQFEENAFYLYNHPLVDHSGYQYGQGDNISKISYINVPFTIERNFGNKIRFNVNAGVFVGFLVDYVFITKVKQRFIPPGQPPTLEIFRTRNQNHNYSKYNFGLSLGGGILIPCTKKINIGLNLQDNAGIFNVANIYSYSSPYDIKTNSLSLTTSISLVL